MKQHSVNGSSWQIGIQWEELHTLADQGSDRVHRSVHREWRPNQRRVEYGAYSALCFERSTDFKRREKVNPPTLTHAID